MKTTGKKMVHSSYPTQKMFAEGGTGSKHVDSNTVVERPLLSYRRDSPTIGFWVPLLVRLRIDAFYWFPAYEAYCHPRYPTSDCYFSSHSSNV
jgi:hypothetical protein